MDIGLFSQSHGLPTRVGRDFVLTSLSIEDMDLQGVARLAERQGFHTIWTGDHIVMDRESDAKHLAANASGKRAYRDRPVILETMVFLTAVTACTTRIRAGTAVLVAPYRHPLVVAQQIAVIDRISGGRITLGVGAGWLEGEFAALGLDVRQRGAMTRESIEIYKLAWTRDWLDHSGTFFQFEDVSMEPKPLQDPHPPILYGGATAAGAKHAVALCDGLFPTFLHWDSRPNSHDKLIDAARAAGREADRDMSGFVLAALAAAHLSERALPEHGERRRPMLSGSAEQILGDLEDLAGRGFSHCALYFDVPSGSISEFKEQIEAIGESVVEEARSLAAVSPF